MSDDGELTTPVLGLVKADGTPTNPAEAAARAAAARRRDPKNPENHLVTLGDMSRAIPQAVIAMGDKMYQQFTQELGDAMTDLHEQHGAELQQNFTHLAMQLMESVERRLYERSLRGRLAALRRRIAENWNAVLIELGVRAAPIAPPPAVRLETSVAEDTIASAIDGEPHAPRVGTADMSGAPVIASATAP